MRATIHPTGINLNPGGEPQIVPLVAGSIHYWRHPPEMWSPLLQAMKEMGFLQIDVYVPWAVHEIEKGHFDFGASRPENDVVRFLAIAHELGLQAIVRPGPHINAELTFFGLPKRIVWDEECQARSPRGNPVVLPILPLAFPVPSYASEKFHQEIVEWYRAVAEVLTPLRHPEGPIVLLQIDNEGAMYFRDGPYDQDYHPDSLKLFQSFLRAKYGVQQALREAWGDPSLVLGTVDPPRSFTATNARELVRHLDWMEFHEQYLSWGIERMAKALVESGLNDLPTVHNFPPGEAATALNAARLSVDLVGLDYYHAANPREHATVMRRTTELVTRAEGFDKPAFSSEMGVGVPPYFAPLDAEDSIFTLVSALAYGLRAFNLYMAVDRDRWVGAPISANGEKREHAERYEALFRALAKTHFHTLRRRAPVRLVVPRALRRLGRAMHAFGPLSPALFNVLGSGFEDSALEDDCGGGSPTAGERYLRAFEQALLDRGVPFAYAGGESLMEATRGAQWIICATGGLWKPEFLTFLRDRARHGVTVTLGPQTPTIDTPGTISLADLEFEPMEDRGRIRELVSKRIEQFSLPTFPVDPESVHVAVHETASGVAKVVIVMNPTSESVDAKVAIKGVSSLTDLLSSPSREARKEEGAFRVRVAPRGIRMFEVTG